MASDCLRTAVGTMAAGGTMSSAENLERAAAEPKPDAWPILPFPSAPGIGHRRGQRKALLLALRISGSPVVLDLSPCRTLNHEDIALLLECVARVAGRDTPLLLVAGSNAIRILLEVTRIAAVAPVFNTVEEALAFRPEPQSNTESAVAIRTAHAAQQPVEVHE